MSVWILDVRALSGHVVVGYDLVTYLLYSRPGYRDNRQLTKITEHELQTVD